MREYGPSGMGAYIVRAVQQRAWETTPAPAELGLRKIVTDRTNAEATVDVLHAVSRLPLGSVDIDRQWEVMDTLATVAAQETFREADETGPKEMSLLFDRTRPVTDSTLDQTWQTLFVHGNRSMEDFHSNEDGPVDDLTMARVFIDDNRERIIAPKPQS